MAITTAMCTSFKGELLSATHDFDASGGNSFKLATLGAATTAFTTTGEVASSGSYVTGGSALTNVNPATSGTTGYTDFADLSYTTATITARGALIYNDTNGDKAVCALDFGGNKTSTAGTFTIAFPAAAASTAIIRIA